MYTSFFGLNEKPFAITPDPRYLYLSERHAEALAHLAYGITEAGGFIQLTGEVGTGKTTVLRRLLQQLPPHCDVALIRTPRVTPAEFLLCICDELHVQVPAAAAGSVKSLGDLLTYFLLAAHGRVRRVVQLADIRRLRRRLRSARIRFLARCAGRRGDDGRRIPANHRTSGPRARTG